MLTSRRDCFKAQFPNKILKSISSAIAGSVSTGQVASPPAIPVRKKGNPNKGPNLSAAPIKRAQPQNGNVLIALSGGPGSLAMVDVLATNAYFGEAQDVLEAGIDARGRRKAVWPRAWTCHVDFSSVAVGVRCARRKCTALLTVFLRRLARQRNSKGTPPQMGCVSFQSKQKMPSIRAFRRGLAENLTVL